MLKTAALSLAFLVQSWAAIDVDVEGDTWLVDYASLTPTRHGLAVWVKVVKPNGEYEMTNYLVDCPTQSLGARYIIKYTSANRVINSRTQPDVLVQKTPAAPGTLGTGIIKAACVR